jgi:hypothetical protein
MPAIARARDVLLGVRQPMVLGDFRNFASINYFA